MEKGDNMKSWKSIKINGIAKIEKCVAEYEVTELEKTPYSKFKIKIYEDVENKFTGYTNLLIKDQTGNVNGGIGYGNSIEEALEDTIIYFLKMLNAKEKWSENDFECSDPFDF